MHDRAERPWRLAASGMLAMAAAIGIGRFVYTPILPPMADALGLSKVEAGLIASANFVGYLAGALAAVTPWFKARPRRALLAFLVVSGVTSAGMAFPRQLAPLMLLRAAGGVASAYVLVLSSVLVLERLGRMGRGDLAPVHFAGVGIGISLSALMTWGLGSAGWSWQAMWLGSGLVTLASAAAVGLLVPAPAPAAPAPNDAPPRAANIPALARLSAAYGLFGFGYVITTTFIVVIVRGSPAAARIEPLFWLAIGIAAIPSVAVWAALARRFGVMKAYAGASLLLAAGVMASVTSGSAVALLLASVLVGGTFMGVTSLGILGARAFAGADPGRWIAIATAVFGVGQIAGPVAAGYGYDLTGSFFLPSVMAAVALCLGAALTFGLERPS